MNESNLRDIILINNLTPFFQYENRYILPFFQNGLINCKPFIHSAGAVSLREKSQSRSKLIKSKNKGIVSRQMAPRVDRALSRGLGRQQHPLQSCLLRVSVDRKSQKWRPRYFTSTRPEHSPLHPIVKLRRDAGGHRPRRNVWD